MSTSNLDDLFECELDFIGNHLINKEFSEAELFCTKDFGCNKWKEK